ncbi:MAG: hypothetical protein SPI30_08360 [Prevotella sp.]|nr:hypothetical protein [Prevotella sp.]
MSSRLVVVIVEGVASYAERIRQTNERQWDESSREATSFAENVTLAV